MNYNQGHALNAQKTLILMVLNACVNQIVINRIIPAYHVLLTHLVTVGHKHHVIVCQIIIITTPNVYHAQLVLRHPVEM